MSGEAIPMLAGELPTFSSAELVRALLSLAVSAVLGALLAFRPRRSGAPPRVSYVIQTQIMLAIVGSLVMLVVGASLARAFGIAGAASLVRYRAKIDDPKDASVMLSALAIGLASGVGLYMLAFSATIFIVVVLWLLEQREPRPTKFFELKVEVKDAAVLKPKLEAALKRNRVKFELRGSTQEEVSYAVCVPLGKKTDRISEDIIKLAGGPGAVKVDWDEKKPK